MLAIAAALLLHVWHASGRSGGLPDWFSPEPFEVAVNMSVYAVPGNYLVHVAKDHRGLTDVVTLRALWPGLEPLRRDNAHLWERRQPARHVHIALMSRPRDGYGRLRGSARFRGATAESVGHGLTRYRRRLEEYYAAEGSETRAPDGSPIALRCPDQPDETKTRFDVERNCIVEYPLSDGVGLHYHFFMVNLAQWREIDRAVRALVDGFRRPADP